MLPSLPEGVGVFSARASPSAVWARTCFSLLVFLLISWARAPELSVSHNRLVQRFGLSAAGSPAQTPHPASSLPPTTGPKRRGHAVSETRPRQVVLGSGYRRCAENQMPAAAGLLVRPPDVSFNFGRSISCLRAPRCACEVAALLP